MADRPLIGITTYRELASWGVWTERADVLHANYSAVVQEAGGIPVLLPAATQSSAAASAVDPAADVVAELAVAVVDRIDALIIAGGADVDPARYGAQVHERTASWRPERDAWELALLRAAADVDLPVLGICRGMQVMAVHAGGELEQHTPDVVGHEQHGPGGDVFGDVQVQVVAETAVAAILGDELPVCCHHHQSVRTHPGLVSSAYAADGTLEAVEDPQRSFWLGVQWHPETGTDLRLFEALVAAAR